MVAPLVAVSRGQGIQADGTQGKVLQAGLCAASSGWGEGTAPPPLPPRPPWLVLGCPGGTSCPPLRPSTAVCPRPHSLCNLLLPLFGVLF